MSFNIENAIGGFAYGALSGYDTLLKEKRKEDYENRLEEARMARQKNLAMWQEKSINAPNREEARTNQLSDIDSQRTYENDPTNLKNKLALDQFDEQKRMNSNTISNQEAQLGLSRENLAISRQNADTSRQNADASRDYNLWNQEEKKKDAEDPMRHERKANEIFAQQVYDYSKKKGASEEDALAAKNVAIMSGAKTTSEFNTMNQKSDGAVKQALELGSEIAKATSKRVSETIATGSNGEEAIIQEATKLVGRNVSDTSEAARIIIGSEVQSGTLGYLDATKPTKSTADKPLSLNSGQEEILINDLRNGNKDAEMLLKNIERVNPSKAAAIRVKVNTHSNNTHPVDIDPSSYMGP